MIMIYAVNVVPVIHFKRTENKPTALWAGSFDQSPCRGMVLSEIPVFMIVVKCC